MRELLDPHSAPADGPQVISDEQRRLRRQRTRIEANILRLEQERDAPVGETGKPTIAQRLRRLGARAYIYNKLGRLRDDLAALTDREKLAAQSHSYIAQPMELKEGCQMPIEEKCATYCPRANLLIELNMGGAYSRRARARLGDTGLQAVQDCRGPFERYTPYTLINSGGTSTTDDGVRWLERVCAAEVALLPILHSGTAVETPVSDDDPTSHTHITIV
jgi:hypothetical protein